TRKITLGCSAIELDRINLGACDLVAEFLEVASYAFGLVALDFDLATVNGASATQGLPRGAGKIFNLLEGKMGWKVADNDYGFSAALCLFASQNKAGASLRH
ncbi:MAG TPA: hypothetical protein VIT23_10100, partial [Terrimicrobiaceae bacterium]